jgi:hypothetical protein
MLLADGAGNGETRDAMEHLHLERLRPLSFDVRADVRCPGTM